jgi:hypothetical protein
MTHNIFSTDSISFINLYDPLLSRELSNGTDAPALPNSSKKTAEAVSAFFSSQSSLPLKSTTSIEELQPHKRQKLDPSNQPVWDDVDISVFNPITLETTDPFFSLPSESPFILPNEDAFWTGTIPLEQPKHILQESNSEHASLCYESNSSSSSPAPAPGGEAEAQADSSVNLPTAKPPRPSSLKKATPEQLLEAAQQAINENNTYNVIKKYKENNIIIPQSNFYRIVDKLKNKELNKATKEETEKAAIEAIEIDNIPEVIKKYKEKGILITRNILDSAVKKQKKTALEQAEDASQKVTSVENSKNKELKKANKEEMRKAAIEAIEINNKPEVIKKYKEKGILITKDALNYAVKKQKKTALEQGKPNVEKTEPFSTHTNWIFL